MAHGIVEIGKINARRGADVLLEILKSEGVECIAGHQIHSCAQEASAVAMADSYGQAANPT